MKKIKKFLALLVTATMFTTVLAGCGGKTSNSETADYELNGDKIYPIKTDVTLTYWMPMAGNWAFQYENFGDTPLAKELEKRTGIHVEYIHPQTGQGSEQFNLMIASGELPDIVQTNWATYGGGPDKSIAEGYIYDLTDIMPKHSPALMKKLKDNPDWDKQAKSDTNKYYAYPFIRGEDILTGGCGISIRKDWLDEQGLQVPETIDEWEKTLTIFKEKYGAKRPLTGNLTKNDFMYAYNIAPEFFIDNGKVKYGPYEDSYKDFLETFARWYKNGLIDPEITTADEKTVNSALLNNQVACISAWAGSGMGKWLNAKATTAGVDESFDLIAAPTPVLKKGMKPEFGNKTNSVLMSDGAAISTNCKNVELAARWLDYGYTEEGEMLFNFGIEGESYEMKEKDGKPYPTYTDLILKNPDGLSISEALGLYTKACYTGLMVQRSEYIEQYYQLQQQKDALKIWTNNNMKDHLMPDVTVAEDVADDYANKYATVSTYVQEMYVKFLTGQEPVSNFDKYKKQLEEFGVKDLIKYKQEAYNRFLKR